VIEAKGLTKRFGRTVAVDGLDLAVRPGVVTGFLGPNGSGKSTTMRLLLGLDRPDAGTATFDGRPYRDLEQPMRQVGALLDAGDAHPGRSARNHLRWMAHTIGVDRHRIDEVLGMVGLREVADKRVGGFSLGMRQRLGLAGALLGDPPTLLLDEPANGLDPEGIRWIRQLLAYLAGQGRTIFVSSHLLGEMSLVADDLVVIARGRLIFEGLVPEFVAMHTTARVKVQSPRLEVLEPAVRHAGGAVQRVADGLEVSGLDAAAVGDVAFRAGVPLHELTTLHASLEDAFMEVTRDMAEFAAGSPGPPRAGLAPPDPAHLVREPGR
jgi:ABC-2 type transport system ATP-binding protein